MLDIDHFKEFNDTYGHLVGDNILKHISKIITQSKRSIDFVARYGGEEFSVILLETGLDEAIALAERIRKNIESSRTRYNDHTYSVTISIGIAEYKRQMKNPEELISQADQALYRAKAEGRNRVETYKETLS